MVLIYATKNRRLRLSANFYLPIADFVKRNRRHDIPALYINVVQKVYKAKRARAIRFAAFRTVNFYIRINR